MADWSLSDPTTWNWGEIAKTAVPVIGGLYAANQATNAQQNVVNDNLAAGQQAAEMAAFRPVGVTTRFGKSGFQYDDQGRLTGAGYQVAPDIAAQREALLGLSGGSLAQAQAAQGYMPQYQGAAQSLFGLGSQFLPTSTAYSASPESGQYANFLRQQAAMAAPAGFAATPTTASQQYSNQLAGIAGAALPTSFEGRTSAGVSSLQNALNQVAGQAAPTSFNVGASGNISNLQSALGAEAARLQPADYSGRATAESQALYNQLARTAGQVMPTSYDTQTAAQRYTQQQQGLLAPQREQQLAQIRNQLMQTGRTGLATGATAAGSRAATNPEMAAYYNAIAQQDAQIAANAEQQARANLQSDIGLASQLGTTGLNALTSSQQQQLANALQRGQLATGLQTTGATLAEQSANQALQNALARSQYATGLQTTGTSLAEQSAVQAANQALARGQFGTGLMSAGYGATTAAGQQQLANAMQLGQFASGQMGTALQAQQAAEEIARQRMLSNIQTGQGLFGAAGQLLGQGYGLQTQALAPWQSYLSGAQTIEGLGQQSLTTGTTLGSSQAAAGAQGANALLSAQRNAMVPQTTAAGYQAAATQGAIQGLADPIAQLIGGLTRPAQQTVVPYQQPLPSSFNQYLAG